MSENTWRLIDRSNPMLRHKVSGLIPRDREKFVYRLIMYSTPSAVGDSTVRSALESISACGSVSADPARSQELFGASKLLDDEYFTSKEEGEYEAVWERKFQESRLAFALHLIFSGTGPENLPEIIYELAHASGRPESFLSWAESLLEGDK